MTTVAASAPAIASADEAIAVAQTFADSLHEGVIERDRAGAVPYEALARLDASGLLAITVPQAYGGPELSVEVLAEVIRRIAAVDPAIAQAPQGHFLLVDVLAVWGSEPARERLFAEVLAGARLGNALAERGGKHAQDLSTRLAWENGRPRVSGRKYYCTGAISSRWVGASALDDEDRVVLAFFPRDGSGVEFDEDWNVMGQRATVSGGAVFTEVEVDPELVIPYQDVFAMPQQFGARAQLVHAAIQVGIAGGALRDLRAFVQERARPFFEAARAGWAETAGADPYVIQRFGRLSAQVHAAELMLADAAATQARIGRIPADEQAAARGSVAVARAKAFVSEVAVAVASDLFSLTGASAADERHDLSRHWRNARTHASHDPVDWKYHHVGNYLLNGGLPPNHGQL